ncbi:MAG: lactonase family protein, partial [Candidatus Latescibacterota bacterium]|nr:lactonase family protein [Candidatus Latescibacterota bacterium]
MADDLFVYAGTYTNRGGKGTYAFRFCPEDGGLDEIGEAVHSENPSFLTIHPSGRFLYATNENNGGAVTAYTIEDSGSLVFLNEQPSHGDAPCHLVCDTTGKFLIVVNYTSGTVSMYPVDDDGSLGDASHKIQHEGSSVGPRQQGPHAHSVNIDAQNRFAYVADLGMDKVLIYEMNLKNGKLNRVGDIDTKPGAGPRHFDFHPNRKNAYLINEIGCTVTALTYDAATGALGNINTISTLPGEVEKGFSTADIHVHPNGKFVYGSNRGHNTIACYLIDDQGTIAFVDR